MFGFFPSSQCRRGARRRRGQAPRAEVAGALTPVPGGVGPLTIAMLMANTLKAATFRRGARLQSAALVERG